MRKQHQHEECWLTMFIHRHAFPGNISTIQGGQQFKSTHNTILLTPYKYSQHTSTVFVNSLIIPFASSQCKSLINLQTGSLTTPPVQVPRQPTKQFEYGGSQRRNKSPYLSTSSTAEQWIRLKTWPPTYGSSWSNSVLWKMLTSFTGSRIAGLVGLVVCAKCEARTLLPQLIPFVLVSIIIWIFHILVSLSSLQLNLVSSPITMLILTFTTLLGLTPTTITSRIRVLQCSQTITSRTSIQLVWFIINLASPPPYIFYIIYLLNNDTALTSVWAEFGRLSQAEAHLDKLIFSLFVLKIIIIFFMPKKKKDFFFSI